MTNIQYAVDPENLKAVVDGIRTLFDDAAREQCLDIGTAVELLTEVVRLVEPDYTPPEPDEVEPEPAEADDEVPDITATCLVCDEVIAVCGLDEDGEYVWIHVGRRGCDDPDPEPSSVRRGEE